MDEVKPEKKEIDPLPDDDTTEHYTLGPPLACERGGHSFKYVSGTNIKCGSCPVGYIVPVGSELKEGHLYIKEQLLV